MEPANVPVIIAPEMAAKKGGHKVMPVKNPTTVGNRFAAGSIFNFRHHDEWGKLLNSPNKTSEIPMI
ncbi:MAG TPA: hypothetical protein VK469_02250, partial [Candidatus Kapabacteria bacterium]|nr:hypothetical protein [Candidatus Kapabacteria bacterium]